MSVMEVDDDFYAAMLSGEIGKQRALGLNEHDAELVAHYFVDRAFRPRSLAIQCDYQSDYDEWISDMRYTPRQARGKQP